MIIDQAFVSAPFVFYIDTLECWNLCLFQPGINMGLVSIQINTIYNRIKENLASVHNYKYLLYTKIFGGENFWQIIQVKDIGKENFDE